MDDNDKDNSTTSTEPWNEHQLRTIAVTIRVSSVLSLMGALFIILTFASSKSFHKPINRIAFFSSFGNVLTNFATLVAQDGIEMGAGSSLCTVQGFMITWFMVADALFILCMAFNTYLTVCRSFTATRLKRLEIFYVIGCYGVPFVPAFTYIFVKNTDGVSIYGPATYWCWIVPEWRMVRIIGFYIPIWIVLLLTLLVYILAGKTIFSLCRSGNRATETRSTSVRLSLDRHLRYSRYTRYLHGPSYSNQTNNASISSVQANLPRLPPLSIGFSNNYRFERLSPGTDADERIPMSRYLLDKPLPPTPMELEQAQAIDREVKRASHTERAAWAYTRCAILFFVALLFTWLPSSINKSYSMGYPNQTNYTQAIISAIVLPTQGCWNGLIYIITTWPACKTTFRHGRRRVSKWFRKLRHPGSERSPTESSDPVMEISR